MLVDELRARTRDLVHELAERAAAEEAAAASQAFAQTVVDAMPSHVAVIESNGTSVATNEAWAEFAESKDKSQSSES